MLVGVNKQAQIIVVRVNFALCGNFYKLLVDCRLDKKKREIFTNVSLLGLPHFTAVHNVPAGSPAFMISEDILKRLYVGHWSETASTPASFFFSSHVRPDFLLLQSVNLKKDIQVSLKTNIQAIKLQLKKKTTTANSNVETASGEKPLGKTFNWEMYLRIYCVRLK